MKLSVNFQLIRNSLSATTGLRLPKRTALKLPQYFSSIVVREATGSRASTLMSLHRANRPPRAMPDAAQARGNTDVVADEISGMLAVSDARYRVVTDRSACAADDQIAPPVVTDEAGSLRSFANDGERLPVHHHRVGAREALHDGVAEMRRRFEQRRKPGGSQRGIHEPRPRSIERRSVLHAPRSRQWRCSAYRHPRHRPGPRMPHNRRRCRFARASSGNSPRSHGRPARRSRPCP